MHFTRPFTRQFIRLFTLVFIFALAACSASYEDVGEVTQAVATGYPIVGVKVAANASTFFVDDGEFGSGAFVSNINSLSYNTLAASLTYATTLVTTPTAIGCTANFVADTAAAMRAGILALPAATRSSARVFWLVPQRAQGSDLAPGCDLLSGFQGGSTGFGFTPTAAQISGLGVRADVHWIIASSSFVDADSLTSRDAVGNWQGGAFNLTHEWLHGQPAVTLAEQGENYGAHDGVVTCNCSGTCNVDQINCGINPDGAAENFLTNGQSWGTSFAVNQDAIHAAINETVEHKFQSHFFDHMTRPGGPQPWVANAPNGALTGSYMLFSHDRSSASMMGQQGYAEVRIPRPDGRVVYLEARTHNWVGCSGGVCGTVDAPGVYAWVALPLGPGAVMHPRVISLRSATQYAQGAGPLVGGIPNNPPVWTTIEPHLLVGVTTLTSDLALISVDTR